MKAQIVSQIINGEEILVNSKGCEDIEFEPNDISVLSDSPKMRLLGIGGKKGLFKLTLNSYKQVVKELETRGIIWKFIQTNKK